MKPAMKHIQAAMPGNVWVLINMFCPGKVMWCAVDSLQCFCIIELKYIKLQTIAVEFKFENWFFISFFGRDNSLE